MYCIRCTFGVESIQFRIETKILILCMENMRSCIFSMQEKQKNKISEKMDLSDYGKKAEAGNDFKNPYSDQEETGRKTN